MKAKYIHGLLKWKDKREYNLILMIRSLFAILKRLIWDKEDSGIKKC